MSFLFLAVSSPHAKPWKSAEVITKETFKYGAFEARILASGGGGVVTPFFLWKDGSEVPGAKWQEQDFEIFGRNGYFQTQAMTPGTPQRTEHVKEHVLPYHTWERYYTYRMEWTPDSLCYYVNGVLVRKETDKTEFAKLLDPSQAEASQLRVGIWAGDYSWSGMFDTTVVPTASFVNWIRVYDYTPGTGASSNPNYTLRWQDDFNSWNWSRWWTAAWTFEASITDYVSENATAKSGALVVALTSSTGTGRFPEVPLDTFPEAGNATMPAAPVHPVPDMTRMIYSGRTILDVKAESFESCLDFTFHNKGSKTLCGDRDLDLEVVATNPPSCGIASTLKDEWAEYVVNLPESGPMGIVLRTASYSGLRLVDVSVDGQGYRVQVPYTESWTKYTDTRVPWMNLTAGPHRIRIRWETSGVNVNGFRIEKLDDTTPYEIPAAHQLPAVIEAEDFVRWYDLDTANTGRSYRSTSVDVRQSAGGYYITNTNAGEWTEYDIVAPWSGMWGATIRLASQYASKAVSVYVDGKRIEAAVPSPSAGAEAWSDVAINPFHLDEGTHSLRIRINNWGVNVDNIGITSISKDPPTKVPEVVSGLSATLLPGEVDLSWSKAAGAASYTLFRRSADGNVEQLSSGALCSFRDNTVADDAVYDYHVVASNVVGNANPSEVLSVRTLPAPDEIAPVLVRQAGTENSTVSFAQSLMPVSWVVTDNSAGELRVAINGALIKRAGNGSYEASIPLAVGENAIRISASDAYGNTNTDEILVVRQADQIAPVLTRQAGTEDQTVAFATASVEVSWRATDNDAISSVTVAGIPASGSAGIFSAIVPLAVGVNQINAVALDAAGNTISDAIHVVRLPDQDLPTLLPNTKTYSQTVDNSITQYTVGWIASDIGGVANVTINGVAVQGDGASYERTVALAVGENVIKVEASDAAGNMSRDSIVITRAEPPADIVKAQYRAGSVGVTNGIRPQLRLMNAGATAVPLSEITVRYWFTKDGTASLSYWCDWAQIGGANVRSRFVAVSPARLKADTYLELSFSDAAGALAAGASTGEIQSRFSKNDWSNFDQSNDASHDASKANAYADWEGVTVYRNGALIWGTEPR